MPHIYGLDEDQISHARRAADIAAGVLGRHAAEVDAHAGFPHESVTALGREGLLGLSVPADFGGAGQGPRTFAAVTEELAQACGSTAMVYVMHVSATAAIIGSSTLGGRSELLQRIAKGQHLTTLAFSESGSRSQFWAPLSRLEERDGGFVASARKSWVTSAQRADSYVSCVQKPGARSPLESTLHLVRRGNGGVRVAGAFEGLGLRGNDSAPVTLDNLPVGPGDLLTEQGEGLASILQVVLPWFSVGTAAMANGLCRSAVAATARHLQEAGFEHTGTRLRDLPTLRARLAQMNVRTEQARALLGYTLGEIEQPSESTPLFVLQTRLASVEAALEVTDLAMKACGGAAFSRHLGVERLFRDARAGWVMAPTVDHLQEFVGRALTGLPLL
jgi:alkylation response protein AidB-like acyl-CoA dehydrogenase